MTTELIQAAEKKLAEAQLALRFAEWNVENIHRKEAERDQSDLAWKALKQVEWTSGPGGEVYCPWCASLKRDGHADDCIRQLSLGEE